MNAFEDAVVFANGRSNWETGFSRRCDMLSSVSIEFFGRHHASEDSHDGAVGSSFYRSITKTLSPR
jgi:hypothetical protein